jgi:hypothetical protein
MDYDALAKKYGGVDAAPVIDYDALAKQYGGADMSAPSEIPGQRQQPGLMARLGRGAASLADVTVGGVLPAVVQQVGYPLARLGRSPEQAQAATARLVSAVESPVGKAFGVTETPEYQSETGRQIIDFIGQNVQKGAKWIAGKTGIPQSDVENYLGTATLTAPKVVPPVAREVAAVAAPVVQDIKASAALPFQKQIQARRERLSLDDYARGPQIDAIKDAQRLELFLNPLDVKSSPTTRAMAMASGEEGLRNIANKNISRVQQVGRNEMNLPPTTQLNSSDAFDTARAKVAGPYEEVKKLPVQRADPIVVAGLEKLRPNQALIGKDAVAATANGLIDEALAKTQGGLNGAQLLDNVSSLRADAQKTHRSLGSTPAQIDLANTQLAIATQLESMLDSSISNPRLLGQWREARQSMARTYAYEGATDFNTGLIDVSKLAQITAKDNALSGDIAALGRIAGNFPSAFTTVVEAPTFTQRVISRGGPAGTAGGLTAAMLGADWQTGIAAGTGAAVLGYLGSKYAANRLASPGFQAGLTPRDARIPVPQPPLGPTIPQNRMLAPYEAPVEVLMPGQGPYQPNFVMQPNQYAPQVTPVAPDLARALPAPSAQATMAGLRAEQQRAAGMSRTLGQQAEAQQAAAEAAARRPTSREVILDINPLTGLPEISTGLRGATPATFQDFGSSLKSAAEKATAGRMFDMTAAEKVAWNKTKVDLAEVVPGMKSLSNEAVAARIADREWAANAVASARAKVEALARQDALLTEQLANRDNLRLLARDIESKQRQLAKVKEDSVRIRDLADMLDETMRAARPDTSRRQQGPKTRAAKRNALAPEKQNALAP